MDNKNQIKCPNCNHLLDVDGILRSSLSAKIESDYKIKWDEKFKFFKNKEKQLIEQKNIFIKNKEEYDENFKTALDEKINWSDGDWYKGEFVKDKKHGKGYFRYSNGESYTGEFLNDKKLQPILGMHMDAPIQIIPRQRFLI